MSTMGICNPKPQGDWEYRFFRYVGKASDKDVAQCLSKRCDVYFPCTDTVGLKLRDRDISMLELKFCVERTADGVEAWVKKVFPTNGCVTVSQDGVYVLSVEALETVLGSHRHVNPVKTAVDGLLERRVTMIPGVLVGKHRKKYKTYEVADVVIDYEGTVEEEEQRGPWLYKTLNFEEGSTAEDLKACVEEYFGTVGRGDERGSYQVMGFPKFVLSAAGKK
eukprot:PhF_6_TR17429/c0_g1_i1/m.26675